MTDEILTEVSGINDIRNLPPDITGLKGIDLKDADLLRIAGFSFLERLDLSGCELLTDRAVIEVRRLVRLRALDLSLCGLITDWSVMALAGLPGLQWLSLNWCYGITDVAMTELAKCISLESVSLWSCEEITDVGVELLSRLPRLRRFELPEFAKITDKGLNALAANACNLEVLRLDHLAGISDDALGALRSLKWLTKLTVQGCKGVTDVGITVLQSALPGCQITFGR